MAQHGIWETEIEQDADELEFPELYEPLHVRAARAAARVAAPKTEPSADQLDWSYAD